jgi:hypothetical protein
MAVAPTSRAEARASNGEQSPGRRRRGRESPTEELGAPREAGKAWFEAGVTWRAARIAATVTLVGYSTYRAFDLVVNAGVLKIGASP